MSESSRLSAISQGAWEGSVIKRMLPSGEHGDSFPLLICTDIDNSFQMSDRSLDHDSRFLFRMLTKHRVPLCAITESHFQAWNSVRAMVQDGVETISERIESHELPYFPVVAADMGTRRYILFNTNVELKNRYKEDITYRELMLDKGFERRSVVEKLQKFFLHHNAVQPKCQINFEEPVLEKLFLQTDETEQPFRVGSHFFAETETEAVLLEESISQMFSSYEVVVREDSKNQDLISQSRNKPASYSRKYYLDVLPVTKYYAVKKLSESWTPKMLVVVGGSAVDSEMLFPENDDRISRLGGAAEVFFSVVVGGAAEILKSKFSEIAKLPNSIQLTPNLILTIQESILHFYYCESGPRLGPASILNALYEFFTTLKNSALIDSERRKRLYSKLSREIEDYLHSANSLRD